MHSKQLGNIGEVSVAKQLMKMGYAVFTELGDLSKIDLIAVKDSQTLRIQVKYCKEQNGTAVLYLYKSGPNYRVKYTKDQIDLFALYVPERDIVLFISSEILDEVNNTFTIRIEQPKKKVGNQYGYNWWEDYLELP
tara:strand:- start:291 stop:698 length:408 start_codon:yes stop_codon:yes gene_type:complete